MAKSAKKPAVKTGKRKRGHHLELAQSGALGAEMAEKVTGLVDKSDPAPKPKKPKVSGKAVKEEIASVGSSPTVERASPTGGSSALKIPLPSGFDEWSLSGLASSANKERAVRLRVLASLYGGLSPADAADANGVDLGKVYLWLGRFRDGGIEAL
nr:hypothetical protein [Neorhizobium tomejilense]